MKHSDVVTSIEGQIFTVFGTIPAVKHYNTTNISIYPYFQGVADCHTTSDIVNLVFCPDKMVRLKVANIIKYIKNTIFKLNI